MSGPNRSFGGYYRTSDDGLGPEHIRGVPLHTVEDTATAAVRLGYRIVDAQISRGLDMARRLRGAADRAGASSDDVLDSAENLLSRGFLLGLEWLESAANQPGNPLKRLVTAEYRLLGALFGLKVDAVPEHPGSASPRSPEAEPVKEKAPAAVPRRQVRVRHAENSDRRAVSVVHWEYDAPARSSGTPRHLRFHSTVHTAAPPLEGTWTSARQAAPILEVTTNVQHPSGRWRAAICESDGEQVGIIDIVI